MLQVDEVPDSQFSEMDNLSYATAYALASYHNHISERDMLSGYLWAWLENQVAAAIKIVPLGQTEGQKILRDFCSKLDQVIELTYNVADDEIGASAPGVALASSWHEVQYSRLFRS